MSIRADRKRVRLSLLCLSWFAPSETKNASELDREKNNSLCFAGARIDGDVLERPRRSGARLQQTARAATPHIVDDAAVSDLHFAEPLGIRHIGLIRYEGISTRWRNRRLIFPHIDLVGLGVTDHRRAGQSEKDHGDRFHSFLSANKLPPIATVVK